MSGGLASRSRLCSVRGLGCPPVQLQDRRQQFLPFGLPVADTEAQEAQAALLAVASAYSMVSACLGEDFAEPRLPAVGGLVCRRGF